MVKSTYFDEETVFRHMNECLVVMSDEENQHHFRGENGQLKPMLIITVDGGGDERPRNKATKFCTTLLQKILDLDKIKVISFAEHDSKLHSVERIHSAENYALSQNGVISSHSVYKHEISDSGAFDETKIIIIIIIIQDLYSALYI
jgi:hypothetical protein